MAEAGFVIGLISGVISIIEATKKVYDAAKDAQGQPEAFRQVAARLPLVIQILHGASLRAQGLNETEQEALEPTIESCKAKAEALQKVFRKVIQKDDGRWYNQYKKAVGALGKQGKVEGLMADILKDINILACEKLVGAATDVEMKEIEEAIKQMKDMPSSLEDETGDTLQQQHSGSGDIIGVTGESVLNFHKGTGDMYHNVISGGATFGVNATNPTFNFLHRPAAARADYAGHYAHSSLHHPVRTFVDRPALHHQIRQQLDPGSSQDGRNGTRMLAVWGLGGAGKTQLVLDYLCQRRTDYKATFWIEAERNDLIERDFVAIYRLLFEVHITTGQEIIKANDAVARVKSWLSNRSRDRWLIVFDGADSVDDEDDGYIDLMRYVPESRFLDVIVTTRSRTAKDVTALEGVEVGEMEEAQAVDLFYTLSALKDRSQYTEDEVTLLVKELGLFALAITLAGTYVAQTPRLLSDIKQYLPEYRDRRRELLSQKPKRLVHQYGESVLTTWEASFKAVQRQCAEACQLMTLLAFLGFDDIFLELFHPGPFGEDGYSRSWTLVISPDASLDKYKIEECFRTLQTYSLVQWKEDQASYSMHKLVHAWGYERLEADQQRDFSAAGLQVVREAMSSCREEPQAKLRLVPHAMANFSMIVKQDWLGDGVKTVLSQLERSALFAYDLGQWAEACAVQSYIYGEWKRVFGEEHPSTISAMNNLANTLRGQGQLKEAAAMQKEVVEKRKQILGREHPDTISAMSNLANTLRGQGQLKEAAAMQKEVVEKMKQILSKEHPNTILAISNLANTLGDQGQLKEAAAMKKEVVEKRKQILGEEHPDTIVAMNNLASTLRDQGQLKEAAAMQKEVLEKRKRILGEEHPSTILAINNLANTLRDQGQLKEAAAMLKDAYARMTTIHGTNHTHSKLICSNAASLLLEIFVQSYNETLEENRDNLCQKTLIDFERMFGRQRESTNILRKTVADIYYRQEKLSQAEDMYYQALRNCESTSTYKGTLRCDIVNSLSQLLLNCRKWTESEAMFRQELEISGSLSSMSRMLAISGIYETHLHRCVSWWQEKGAQRKTSLTGWKSDLQAGDLVPALAHLCIEFGTVWPSFFNLLGSVLIWAQQKDNAVIAFQHHLQLIGSDAEQANIVVCNGCRKQLNADMQRFVCEICTDVDLCEECSTDYEIDGRASCEMAEDCYAHPFLAVPSEEGGNLDILSLLLDLSRCKTTKTRTQTSSSS
ncbi:hypothetical protein B0J11DRAFT_581064 [Dendryphion nanum]|uniref:NACHT-NTPase and P-loop NTPases N-terminal domain-containing protein n=1 Tax=Dendryphion nanum TaxID=256645 RepID=A0A9P9IJB6_9PLEO|nr:hypothetical protein B0J11DRAFT_581064 [Dendryphion nanum]